MLDENRHTLSVLTERGGRRLPYLLVCRILSKMAEAFFSSLWRIRELYGGADIYAGRYRDVDARR